MSELISGKEALIALANGEDVDVLGSDNSWIEINDDHCLSVFRENYKFRLKPRTIKINGVEVPETFKPKEGERFYYVTASTLVGWSYEFAYDQNKHMRILGAWRTQREVEQTLAALRSVFNES